MITLLRVLRVTFAAIGLWQIIGIVPVVTWVSNPRAVTLGMAASIVFKAVVAAICAGAFYWLGKLKRKRSTAKERIGDVAIAGISLVAMVIVVVVVALVLPSRSDSVGSQTEASSPQEPPSQSNPQAQEPATGPALMKDGRWGIPADNQAQEDDFIRLHPDILYGKNAAIVAENMRALRGTNLNYLGMLRTAYGVAKLDARWQSQP